MLQVDVANALAVSVAELNRWLADGCPVKVDGAGRKTYDLADIVRWRLARQPRPKAKVAPGRGSLERLRAAQADLAELELAGRRRELIPTSALVELREELTEKLAMFAKFAPQHPDFHEEIKLWLFALGQAIEAAFADRTPDNRPKTGHTIAPQETEGVSA